VLVECVEANFNSVAFLPFIEGAFENRECNFSNLAVFDDLETDEFIEGMFNNLFKAADEVADVFSVNETFNLEFGLFDMVANESVVFLSSTEDKLDFSFEFVFFSLGMIKLN